MTKEQAVQLRKVWKAHAAEGEVCDHNMLILESTDEGYLTGTYFCAICGEHIYRQKR